MQTLYFAEFRLHKTWEPIAQKVSQPMHLHTIKWALVIERESTDWTLWWVDEQKIAAQTTTQRNHSEFWPEERSQSKNNKIKQKKSEISHSVCSFICLPKSYGLLFCYANTVHFRICECVCKIHFQIKSNTQLWGNEKIWKKWSTEQNRVQFFISANACAQFIVCCCGCRCLFSYCYFNRTILLIK